jgi:drug/metabolite transporter (DMT)-like permease
MAGVTRATAVGMTAILLWATLASLTTLAATIPPFQLTAMAFALAFLLGLMFLQRSGGRVRDHLRLPLRVWMLGVGGLFGYHFLYFMALRQAPAVEASLIAYLWPLLIVIGSALLPGERVRWYHLVGATISFSGAALLVTRGASLSVDTRYTAGYLLALGCALTWSTYSVLSRRFGTVPTTAVAGFCGATALLAAAAHLLLETTIWPQGSEWLPVLGLGLGPVGIAFYTWDYGVKKGDIKLLGTTSYAAPLLSTLLLVVLGLAPPSPVIAVASLLIAGGAVLASADSWGSRRG